MIFSKKASDYYCLGDECICIKRHDSVNVGESLTVVIVAGTHESVCFRRQLGVSGVDDIVYCHRNVNEYFYPIRLLTDKERFLYKLSGNFPERLRDC